MLLYWQRYRDFGPKVLLYGQNTYSVRIQEVSVTPNSKCTPLPPKISEYVWIGGPIAAYTPTTLGQNWKWC